MGAVYSVPAYSGDIMNASGLDGLLAQDKSKRGINQYTSSEVMGVSGITQDGKHMTGEIEVPLFGLGIYDRINIAQKCDAVFGVVTGRMNRIAALDWSVQRESKEEDRIEWKLKQEKQIYDEYASAQEVRYKVIRYRMMREILTILPDCLPDLSNFNQSLLRWKKRIEQSNDDASTEIEDWLHQPNAQDCFNDWIKKSVFDDMVHGASASYKQFSNGRLEHFYELPGGSVLPLTTRYVSPLRAFIQTVPGYDSKIYFNNEIMYSAYLPCSGITEGLVPIEALVNKVAETLFFDQRAAEMADGTKPPDKVAVFGGQKVPFGSLNGDEAPELPLEKAEESRLETLLNEPRKNAIRVLSGMGTPAILDLSRSETFASQSDRQRFIRETVAFVFNASNVEVNLTGSDNTSGRSTSETQENIEREKGIYPIVVDKENDINTQIIPFRFGSNYVFKFKSGLSDEEQAKLDLAKMQTGTYSVNEVRIARGEEPAGPEFDKPGQGGQQMQPDGSANNPFNFQQAQ